MNIPAEAVEAAAELVAVEMGTPSTPHIYRHLARKTLEAAAPYMLATEKADIWDEGWGAPGYATNPYRSQA